MHRNERHWLTDHEIEYQPYGQSLEEAVAEIHSLVAELELAFSGVELMTAAIRAKELGFDRYTAFWPSGPGGPTFGMAWHDDEDLVKSIEPPPDRSPGWKLDPHYGDRLRYWHGGEWDAVVAPAPGNLSLFKRIADGGDADEDPAIPPVQPGGKGTRSDLRR